MDKIVGRIVLDEPTQMDRGVDKMKIQHEVEEESHLQVGDENKHRGCVYAAEVPGDDNSQKIIEAAGDASLTDVPPYQQWFQE